MKISKINKTAPKCGLHFGEIFVIPLIQKYDFFFTNLCLPLRPEEINRLLNYPQDCKPIIIQLIQ